MADKAGLEPYIDIPFPIEAVVAGPRLKVKALMGLTTGSIIATSVPAGDNVEVRAGGSAVGVGELAAPSGRLIVRLVTLKGKA